MYSEVCTRLIMLGHWSAVRYYEKFLRHEVRMLEFQGGLHRDLRLLRFLSSQERRHNKRFDFLRPLQAIMGLVFRSAEV